MPHFKKLTEPQRAKIERVVKGLLHASRDAMRNRHRGLTDQISELEKRQRMTPDHNAWLELQRHIDTLTNRRCHEDTRRSRFVISDGYYGEAFGMFRTLEIFRYGGISNVSEKTYHNFRHWFYQLEEEVLTEEGFFSGTHECDHCVRAWGKDGVGRNRAALHKV
jgi:hypothetical protein